MFLDRGSIPIPIHPILHAQKRITAHLENTTQLERPGNLARGRKEPDHLHHVTRQPAHQYANPEALAGARLVVGNYLREGERGFDG